jgi:light-regulated signal transduction histidine kinase (bacteriophytochrome)
MTIRAEDQLPANLAECDREPIHVPEQIQAHGMFMLVDADRRIRRISENAADYFNREATDLLGMSVNDVVDDATLRQVDAVATSYGSNAEARCACTTTLPGFDLPFDVIASLAGDQVIVEFEAAMTRPFSFRDLYTVVRQAVSRMESATSIEELTQFAAEEVRRFTGYDRVKVYRFDANWNGRTIAESRAEHMPSFLGLHFPASDIPAQARRLYTTSRIRQIPDIHYKPVPILSRETEPVDLSYSILRSVSPVHIQYLKNMGVGASMSVSILRNGNLWGLIACHHASPITLSFEVRAACDYVAQVLALQVAALEAAEAAQARIRYASLRTSLLARIAGAEDFVQAMAASPQQLLGLTDATGAALVFDDRTLLVGATPSREQVAGLLRWIEGRSAEDVFATQSIAPVYPPAAAYEDKACGVIAINISRTRPSWVLWFRPEVIQTVNWAGDPRKVGSDSDASAAPEVPRALTPRNSFDQWKETVRHQSLAWSTFEIESAAEMRDAIVRIVLKRAEELAALTGELQRTNRELEAFSYSVSHDLRAPFRHIVGYSELLQKRTSNLDDTSRRYLRTITDSARFAGTLVDGLLAFSQMSRTALRPMEIDMRRLVDEVIGEVQMAEAGSRTITWHVGELPNVIADVTMLRSAVRNLLSNAVKYTRPKPEAIVEVGHRVEGNEDVFLVRDNGAGFDPRYRDKLFGVFQRLHRMEDFEGTGIGLANVRRTIERHGGRTWAESALGEGATFYFSLPRKTQQQDPAHGRSETDTAR